MSVEDGFLRLGDKAELTTANHPLRLRAARESDTELLTTIYASTRAEELAHVQWSPEEKEAFVRMQFAAQDKFYHENYPGAEFLILLVQNEPVGRLYLHRRPAEIRIMDITLLPSWRKQGIGAALFDALKREALATRRKLSIHVEIFNRAARLYERLGFQRISRDGVYCLMEWTPGA